MIEPAEVQELCRRLKERGEVIRGSKIYRATLPDSGVTLQTYITVEAGLRAQTTVVQDDELTWFVILEKNYRLRELTVELRGDREKFLAQMTLCRLFDELKPNDDVRMAS